MMDLMEIIRGRRSVRAFRPEAPGREQLERVLEAARWAPSPHGRQPWRFVVLTRADAKARLADAMGEEGLAGLREHVRAVVARRSVDAEPHRRPRVQERAHLTPGLAMADRLWTFLDAASFCYASDPTRRMRPQFSRPLRRATYR